jgi:hypothetical protein
MFGFARLTLIASVAALVLAPVVSAKPLQPAAKAAVIKAEMLRGDALNQKYHLGKYAPPSLQQLQAIRRRSVEMNRYYGLGSFARQPASGFDWGDAGIGGAAVLGAVLLVLAATGLALRRRQHTADAI